jgi:UDP-N-acetylglucosamine enolpyruvyl transferase
MSYLSIEGGAPLHGELTIQGSKNSVLPVLAARPERKKEA